VPWCDSVHWRKAAASFETTCGQNQHPAAWIAQLRTVRAWLSRSYISKCQEYRNSKVVVFNLPLQPYSAHAGIRSSATGWKKRSINDCSMPVTCIIHLAIYINQPKWINLKRPQCRADALMDIAVTYCMHSLSALHFGELSSCRTDDPWIEQFRLGSTLHSSR
jgi:hypothetical protein